MIRLALCMFAWAALAGCAAVSALPESSGARLLVTIHYDAADSLHGNSADRYRRPGGYGAGPNADPVLDALAREYALTRVSGWPMRSLGVHCEI
jgi:hypothetical protein